MSQENLNETELKIDENLEIESPIDFSDNIDCSALNDESQKLKIDLQNAKDDLLRATAEFENIKKRLEKEKISAVSFANESFARDLLPVIDALEIALGQDASSDEMAIKIKAGIEMTVGLFLKTFEKNGILPIDASGEFDPNLHNAINYIETDEVESGKIAQVYQKGYTINGRVLRPSMVVIAK